MSANTESYEGYQGKVVGMNRLTEPADGGTVDLEGKYGATLIVETVTTVKLPAAPIGVVEYVSSTNASAVAVNNADDSTAATLAQYETAMLRYGVNEKWDAVILKQNVT